MTDIRNNSDSELDLELRQILIDLSDQVDNAGIAILEGADRGQWQESFLKAEAALTRWRDRAVVEARIDTLERIDSDVYGAYYITDNGKEIFIEEAIDQLKEQTDEQKH